MLKNIIVATCNIWPSLIQARNSGNLSWVKAILLFLQCISITLTALRAYLVATYVSK